MNTTNSKTTTRTKTTAKKKAPAKVSTAATPKPDEKKTKSEPKDAAWESWNSMESDKDAISTTATKPTSANVSPTCSGATQKPTAAPKRPTNADSAPTTLKELSDRYVEHLKAEGKSESTIFGYSMELRSAMKELGEDTKLTDLTQMQVALFYESDRVTKARSGRPKAMPGILKTRRVLRLALVWAVERGWLAEAPLPLTGKEPN